MKKILKSVREGLSLRKTRSTIMATWESMQKQELCNNSFSQIPSGAKGFSLIELLVSLIVISLIAAALTPIVTKKMSKSNMVVKVAAAKKGLVIYSNPGTYAYDVPEGINKVYISGAAGGGGGAGASQVAQSATFTTTTNFTIPQGVNYMTLTLTGAGGGGGAGNGSSTGRTNCDDPSNEYLFVRGASSGEDICITKKNITDTCNIEIGTNKIITDLAGDTCTSGYCCWAPSGYVSACTRKAAGAICSVYRSGCNRYNLQGYRLLNKTEFENIGRYRTTFSDLWSSSKLNLCNGADPDAGGPGNYTACGWYGPCQGSPSNTCAPWRYMGSDVYATFNGINMFGTDTSAAAISNDMPASSVRCAKPLQRINGTNGGGGSSGQRVTQGFKVLPGDVLKITIGAGGNRGAYGVNVNNGQGARTGNGARGGNTVVEHRRGATLLATYTAQGGYGGWGATTSAHGAAISATGYVTGAAGGATGGAGGAISGISTAARGGYFYDDKTGRAAGARNTSAESEAAKGASAPAGSGGGGGGGYTPSWASNLSSHAFAGGAGGTGRVELSYNLVRPGGGGGAGAALGKRYNSSVNQEIEYPVTPGERLVFTVGRGGDGGASSQDGKNGTQTTFMENKIIFKAGSAGRLNSVGGAAGALTINNSRAHILNATGSNIGTGTAGETGKILPSDNYGFDGGTGGTSYSGIFGGCGGGMTKDSNTQRNCSSYARYDGADGATHNAVRNEGGGSGGGGGGVIKDSQTLGKGGLGADGYIRIRWGEE